MTDLKDGCGCWMCLNDPSLGHMNPVMQRMIVCVDCGNKRCPKSTYHDHPCTRSNESGQPGSRFPGKSHR